MIPYQKVRHPWTSSVNGHGVIAAASAAMARGRTGLVVLDMVGLFLVGRI